MLAVEQITETKIKNSPGLLLMQDISKRMRIRLNFCQRFSALCNFLDFFGEYSTYIQISPVSSASLYQINGSNSLKPVSEQLCLIKDPITTNQSTIKRESSSSIFIRKVLLQVKFQFDTQ